MIGVDTNILVRYFTQDDAEQAEVVEKLIDTHAGVPHAIFINNIVMCELIWVLERGYKYAREEIAKLIKQMLSTEEFAFENQELLWLALNQYNQHNLDFADALIGEINKALGCVETLTFDKGAIKANNFKLAQVKF
jgi:predicted nucleic-acid-binding protein